MLCFCVKTLPGNGCAIAWRRQGFALRQPGPSPQYRCPSRRQGRASPSRGLRAVFRPAAAFVLPDVRKPTSHTGTALPAPLCAAAAGRVPVHAASVSRRSLFLRKKTPWLLQAKAALPPGTWAAVLKPALCRWVPSRLLSKSTDLARHDGHKRRSGSHCKGVRSKQTARHVPGMVLLYHFGPRITTQRPFFLLEIIAGKTPL